MKIMKKLYLLLFLVCPMTIRAQENVVIVGGGAIGSQGKEQKSEVLDQATVRCYYHFTQKKKAGEPELLRDDTLTLDIGKTWSRYYDQAKLTRDTLFKGIAGIDPMTIKSISVLKGELSADQDNRIFVGEKLENDLGDGTTEQVFKNHSTGAMKIVDYELNLKSLLYRCDDEVGALPWTMGTDTATVLNYLCQQATVDFRGRTYTVWFAPEVPVNEGPWKFYGLPGLIMRVLDSEGLFAFECIGLQNIDTPYAIELPQGKYMKCNRKDLAKLISKRSSMTVYNNGGNLTMISKSSNPDLKTLETK